MTDFSCVVNSQTFLFQSRAPTLQFSLQHPCILSIFCWFNYRNIGFRRPGVPKASSATANTWVHDFYKSHSSPLCPLSAVGANTGHVPRPRCCLRLVSTGFTKDSERLFVSLLSKWCTEWFICAFVQKSMVQQSAFWPQITSAILCFWSLTELAIRLWHFVPASISNDTPC